MLRIENKKEVVEIYITGDIIDDADGAFLQSFDAGEGYQWPSEIRAQLDAAKGKPITLYINSNGGSVPAGVAIANMIARHDAPTLAIVDGWCCSIATQAFFAADRRQMPSNAYLMLHKPSTVTAGNADDMLQAAEFLDVIQKGLETTYQQAALDGVDEKKIHNMVERETWLTGEEAAALFDIELTAATPVLNCVSARKAGNMKPPQGLNIKPEAVTQMEDDTADKKPAEVNNDEAARIKAVLAVAKGVMIS